MAQKKVLVADHEPHFLHTLSTKLRSAGYQVLLARNGQEALDTARHEHPDLVIAGYAMPLLSGLELCHRLSRDPQTADIPAIMLTVPGYDVADPKSSQSKTTQRLEKPFTPQTLLTSVQEALSPTFS